MPDIALCTCATVIPRIGAAKFAVAGASVIKVWSTTIFIADTLRAKATPFISVISPRAAGIARVDSISLAAFAR